MARFAAPFGEVGREKARFDRRQLFDRLTQQHRIAPRRETRRRAFGQITARRKRIHFEIVRESGDVVTEPLAQALGLAPQHEPALYAGGEFRTDGELEQAHLALAFPGLRADDEDIYAAQVYSTVLGGGMSSRLFQEAREKRGLCYSIQSFGSSYRDTGLFGVYAGTSEADAPELVKVIAGEMQSLAEGASDDEVARARAQIKAGILMGLEQATSHCEQIAANIFTYGRMVDTQELVAKIDAIDAKAVSRIAAKVLKGGALSLAAMGPVGALGSYDHVAQRFA